MNEKQRRLLELRNKINTCTAEEFDDLEREIRSLQAEIKKEEELEQKKLDLSASLDLDVEEAQERGINIFRKPKDDVNNNEEEKVYERSSKEYESAFAKVLLGQGLDRKERKALADGNKHNDTLQRALGTALTTTSTTFVAPTDLIDGVNNGGMFVPTSISTALLEGDMLTSPILRDVQKMSMTGNATLPIEKSSTGAEWVVEGVSNNDESDEWGVLELNGQELSKTIRISWKLKSMGIEAFLQYIKRKIQKEMLYALANGVIYGTNIKQPNGIINTTIQSDFTESDNLVDNLIDTMNLITEDRRMGAKHYVSTSYMAALRKQKDGAGNYVYPQTEAMILAGGVKVEADPFLKGMDFVTGNLENYVLNINKDVELNFEVDGKKREDLYTSYMIADGDFEPNSLVFGTEVSA